MKQIYNGVYVYPSARLIIIQNPKKVFFSFLIILSKLMFCEGTALLTKHWRMLCSKCVIHPIANEEGTRTWN